MIPLLALVCARAAGAQADKRDAILAPVSVLGEISPGERAILFNRLQAQLSNVYRLVSQESYTLAEEQAFKELDATQCTEEQCIRKIQEILQVDRLFVLQIVRDVQYTQLSLTLARGDSRFVRTSSCADCRLGDLEPRIDQLVAEILPDDGIAPPRAAQVRAAAPEAPAPLGPSAALRRDALFQVGLSPGAVNRVASDELNAEVFWLLNAYISLGLQVGTGSGVKVTASNKGTQGSSVSTKISYARQALVARVFPAINSKYLSSLYIGLGANEYFAQGPASGNTGSVSGGAGTPFSGNFDFTAGYLSLSLGNQWSFASGFTLGIDWFTGQEFTQDSVGGTIHGASGINELTKNLTNNTVNTFQLHGDAPVLAVTLGWMF